MNNILEQLDEEYRERTKAYMEEQGFSEDAAIRNLMILGLSFYYSQSQIHEVMREDDADILLRRALMEANAKYSSLKFNYYEIKKDYERMKLQVSGLIHENRQYQVSYQHVVDIVEEYRKELEIYKKENA
ncbi:hypothetical protein [Geosporobacter ferrireducens]|uniref:Uncharacterized protein n=1 Tax=Geosporobacter ferrireducens TaxID=1424294 RepID=A0A1D8GDL8_9FIRM|nr:hypothetical protein [Geosporobacter ferrireducens]AOT68994.1 hypothetical protein Gferi_05135 [Geosporobacter ferrireducens]MTI58339.1 hypothetical protein [Geosporobacter ferrireducens]